MKVNGFADRLRSLRKEKKLTQAKLAEKIGVSKVTISEYESGDKTPKVSVLQNIADYFEVSTDYLLGRSPFTQTEEELLHNLDMDLEQLKDRFDLRLHGEEITDEQMKAIIAFIKSYRQMKS